MTIDEEVRAMLQRRAGDVQASADAWDRIESRVGSASAAPRRSVRVLGAVGLAAAVLVGVVVASWPDDDPGTRVVTPATVAPEPARTDPVVVATNWLRARVPEGDIVAGVLQGGEGGDASVVFHEGTVRSELFLRDEGEGWAVVAAASDMIPLFDVTFDGHDVNGRATVEAAGTLTIAYFADGEEIGVTGPRPAVAREDVELGMGSSRAGRTATVRALLVVDGVTYVSEFTAERAVDPAVATGEIVSLWPATDTDGLDALQRDADAGERDDLLDPREVAKNMLASVLAADAERVEIGEPQIGDGTSAEVAYRDARGGQGRVLVRRHAGQNGIWYAIGATADLAEITDVRPAASAGALHVELQVGLPPARIEVTALLPDRSPASLTVEPDDPDARPVVVSVPGAADARWVIVVVRGQQEILGIVAQLLP